MALSIRFLATLFVLFFLSSPPRACAAEPLKVGLLMPFSGEWAILGEKIRKGFALAGRGFEQEVQLVYEDIGALGAGQAVRAASKLLQIDKVQVIVGPLGPEQTIPVAKLAAKYNVTVFAFTLCSDAFKVLPNVFCAYPETQQQLLTMLPVTRTWHIKRLACVAEESEFGNETAAILRKLAQQGEFTLTVDQAVPAQERDFRTIATKVQKSGSDGALIAFGNPAQAFVFLKQLFEAGFQGTRFAYIDYDDKYLAQFGAFTEGLIVPGAYGDSFNPDFAKAFTTAYGEAPELYAAEGYDLLRTVLVTLRALKWDIKKLPAAMVNREFPESAIKDFHYTEDRKVAFPLISRVAKHGKFVPLILEKH
jgi:branched-chain amino acid transport system substrate-binding protein